MEVIINNMVKKIKTCFILIVCTCILVSPNLQAKAETIDNMKLSEIINSEEIRVQFINKLYDKKQELYSRYYINKDNNILDEISSINSQLIGLGVSSYSQKEMEDKLNAIQKENNNSLFDPNVVVPPSSSNISWSTYRYYTVIWGKLHEMQIVMAEPTLDRSGPLNNTDVAVRRNVDYGNGVVAAGITILDIAAGELAGKLPGGNVLKSLYDIAKNTSGAMAPDQIIRSADYAIVSASTATFKYGFIKVDGQADYEQKYVYVGNSVIMSYQVTITANAMVNGTIVPKFINAVETVTHKSPSYDNISLRVISSPVYDRCYVIYSLNEPLTNIPYKYVSTTYYHSVPAPFYVEHGLSMYEFYQFFY